ncbi:MAG: hypothetical protein HYY84_09540 [Deltaproteobacteria bacterium]|nr:hypothetical protein [Deltaproteobacteria bacterium]
MRRPHVIALALIVAVVLAVFGQTLSFDFVSFDDAIHVRNNPHVFSPDFFAASFWIQPEIGYSVTLPTLTYALNHALHELEPAGYHLTNVLIHALNAALAFFLLERLGLKRPLAIVAALLFALHPVVAEPVSWITGRKDLLATSFALGALIVWLEPTLTLRRIVVANILFALAALSKPSVFALPLFLVFYDRFVAHRGSLQRAALAITPAIAIAVALGIAAALSSSLDLAIDPARAAPFPLRVFRSLGHRLASLLVPTDHHPYYLLKPATWFEPATILGMSFVALIVALAANWAFRASRAFPLVVLGAISYAPISNIIPLVHEVGDSHLYLPLVSVAGLVALGLGEITERLKPALRITAFAALPVAFIPLTLAQSAIWRDSVTLWSHELEAYPQSARVCHHLAGAFALRGEPHVALAHLERCAVDQESRVELLPSLAAAAAQARDREKYFSIMREMVEHRPDHPSSKQFRDRYGGKLPGVSR